MQRHAPLHPESPPSPHAPAVTGLGTTRDGHPWLGAHPATIAAWALRLPAAVWVVGWFVVVAAAFASRGIMPIDESRYVGVAWEMWQRGDLLLPILNGVPYSHKPPLLFWLIHLGWGLFGVDEWWPRIVPPLFGLGNLALTASLARKLAPARRRSAAPLILLGCLAFTVFTTTLTFDMLVVFFTLVTLHGVHRVWRREGAWTGWLLAAVGLGLGILAKGPVILVFVLPPMLLAPWWGGQALRGRLLRWYAGVLAAVAAGAGIALAWAAPAAAAGGPRYAEEIFLRQTTHRLVSAAAHPEPWWWYLPITLLVFFPFSLWPTLWRRLARLLRRRAGEPSVRFLLSWLIPALLFLSAISSKQPYYLLPLAPAFALLADRALGRVRICERLSRLTLPLAATALLGAALAAGPALATVTRMPHWVHEMGPAPGVILVAACGAGLWLRRRRVPSLPLLAGLSLALFLTLHLGMVAVAAPQYNVLPVARYVAFLEDQGVEVGYAGTYHGQFHFAGRLRQPFTLLEEEDAAAWLADDHRRAVVATYRGEPPAALGEPDFAQPFRTKSVGVWRHEAGAEEMERGRGRRWRGGRAVGSTGAEG